MNAPISSPTMNMTTTAAAFTTSSTATSSSHQCSPSSSTSGNTSALPPPPPPPAQKTPSTDVFIRDLNLVAEAAKRAQMAVLMRDMEGIAIS